jgi:RimJ/RimL family protein N-acetyltransferase
MADKAEPPSLAQAELEPSQPQPPTTATPKFEGKLTTDKIAVRTTLPIAIPPLAQRQQILTERLLIRAATPADFQAWRHIRLQPEVMANTYQATVDTSIAQSQTVYDGQTLPPNDTKTYTWLFFERSTGELVGQGGVVWMEDMWLGWPEVGYMLAVEHWGKGYATEFVKGFLEAWWALPRHEVTREVDRASIAVGGGQGTDNGDSTTAQDGAEEKAAQPPLVRERIVGKTKEESVQSGKILQRNGFQRFKTWQDVDSRPASATNGQLMTFVAYTLVKPEESSALVASSKDMEATRAA